MNITEAGAQKNKLENFEPMIICFSCNWCSYTSADLAGINRYKYPSCVNIVRFMCSGRIEPEFIMKAF
ncbi:MAG: hydrogenase iron-sulfur subunit [Thermoplasmata archaeon]|nr:MAG: hydrogenase iron-sulfur subunit [Thermoplasmata archaeon]